jgi:hypothetical protein
MHSLETNIKREEKFYATNLANKQIHGNQYIELNAEYCDTIFSPPVAPSVE